MRGDPTCQERERRAVPTATRVLQLTFLGSLVGPILLAASLGRSRGWYWLLCAGLVGAAVVGTMLAPALIRRGRSANVLLTLAMLNVLVLTPELVLRRLDFRYESGIEFGFPRGFWSLRLDPDLFWRLPASYPGVNSLGFL